MSEKVVQANIIFSPKFRPYLDTKYRCQGDKNEELSRVIIRKCLARAEPTKHLLVRVP